MLDVITIADEVDSQLKQAMLIYVEPGSARPAAWGQDLTSCGVGSAGVCQFAARIAPRPAVRLWFGSLTIVFQRTSVVGEVASTFPSFRFPELSQPS